MLISRLAVLCMALFTAVNTNAQLWKEYSDSAKVFRDQNKSGQAIVYYKKTRETLRADSLMTATNAQNSHTLANVYMGIEDYKNAETFYLEAKQIREKVLGTEHTAYAATCTNLASLYLKTGQNEKSELLFHEAKAIIEKISGKENATYATICNNLGALYERMEQFKKAEPLFLEGMTIRKKIVGPNSRLYAESCDNLANLYLAMGLYEKAEPVYMEAKQIWLSLYGENNPYYSSICNNLGTLYRNLGLYNTSETYLLEAKRIREAMPGKSHADYATPLNNLASLYLLQSKYEKAEELLIESREVLAKALGRDDPLYAISCSNLGSLYYSLGQYEKAEPFMLEAKEAHEKAAGMEKIAYASACNNLANLYLDMGRQKEAGELYIKARDVLARQLGTEHHNYALANNMLANFLKGKEEYQKAEELFIEARNIQEKVFGKEHVEYAFTCINLANLYIKKRQYANAESLLLESKKIYEKNFGKTHSYYGSSCNDLAKLYWLQSRPELANKEFTESFLANSNGLEAVFQFTSEREKADYLKNVLGDDEVAYSFCLASKSPGGLAYSLSLFHRNLTLSHANQLRERLFFTDDTLLLGKYREWIATREQLAHWLSRPTGERMERDIKLKEKADVLEKSLVNLSGIFKKEGLRKSIKLNSIQQSLNQGEAAIEFIRFQFYDRNRRTDSIYYTASVLRKEKPEPEFLYLFEQRQLDSLLTYKSTSPGQHKLNYIYTTSEGQDNRTTIYDLIWKPLENKLTGIRTIYFAPAGSLHKISFAALPSGKNETLSDKYRLVQLNTTASVTEKMQSQLIAADKIQLFGGILYDADSSSIRKAALKMSGAEIASRSLPEDLNRDAVPEFFYLEGSEKETDIIKKLALEKKYNLTASIGLNATEESFKTLNGKNSPAILHIATHGFFFPDPKNESKDDRAGGASVFRLSDHPLIRSGLALAGANNAWKGKAITGVEDGILTSYEVSNMYLPNTKLAVLSACETGLGDIQGSEGVYGLQRAFKIAGAEHLLMSLWKVPDRETSEFMQEFYRNLFSKQDIQDSFFKAQAILKNKYRNEPYKWAAWVLIR